ncbi:MAG: NAD-dependent epimerase/dehydratase family protein, partial [Alphaproteobacteria bacterium]|nr:NAD-dependent epimerase/dehydratase family protein [Alphaproteobacteria bacterium]
PYEAPGRFVSSLIRNMLNGEIAPMSPGGQIRDFMHSQDAGEAFTTLYEAGDIIGAVNIASGDRYSLLEVAREIQTLIGHGGIDNTAYPLRANDPDSLLADVSRLKIKAGFRPKYDLKTGLAETIEWHRQNLAD